MKRRKFLPRWVVVALFSTVVVAALAPAASQRILIDVAPLCRVSVNGQPGYVNPLSPTPFSGADNVHDSHTEAEYLFEFPRHDSRNVLELSLPKRLNVERLFVLGWSDQSPCSIRVETDLEVLMASNDWKARDGWPPTAMLRDALPFQKLALTFEGDPPVVLANVALLVGVPRWLGWLYVGSWFVVLPALLGIATAFGALGIGRLIPAALRLSWDVENRLVAGLLMLLVAATGCCLFPTAHWLIGVLCVGVAGAAVYELGSAVRNRSTPPHGSEDCRLLTIIALSTFLLLGHVVAESHVLRYNRVVPYDHLVAYLGAQRLSRGLEMPSDMALRPWLVHALYAPWDQLLGRASYPVYLGFMAGLNSLVLPAGLAWLRRWALNTPLPAVSSLMLMPLVVSMHFVGQRLLTTGLALLAVYWWTDNERRLAWLWSGLALTLAIAAHPGALFLVPGAVVYFLWRFGARIGFMQSLRCLALPVTAYVIWQTAMKLAFPDVRNVLLNYPLMTDLSDLESTSFLTLARSLSFHDWLELLGNRLRHLPHYFWSPTARNPTIELFRSVSLVQGLGLALTVGLFRPSVWRQHGAFVWLAIAGPLLIHHLHIGQPHPQFHIFPLPFLAVALLLVGEYSRRADQLSRCLLGLALVEWFLRGLYPVYLAIRQAQEPPQNPLFGIRLVPTDALTNVLLVATPIVFWMVLFWSGRRSGGVPG